MENLYKLKFKVKSIRYKGNFQNVIANVEILEAQLIEGNEYFPALRECNLKGKFLKVEEGDIFTTEGILVTDKGYNQFVFECKKDCVEFLPAKKDEVIKYIFRKTKKKLTMKRIGAIMDVTHSGCSLLKKIYKDEAFLDKYEDITKREKHMLKIVANENYALDEILMFFNELGVSSIKAVQFFDKWGIAALSKIKKDPYYLVLYEFLNVSEADKIMLRVLRNKNKELQPIDVPWDSKERVSACLFESLIKTMQSGDSYALLKTVCQKAVPIISQDRIERLSVNQFLEDYKEIIEQGLLQLTKSQVVLRRVINEKDCLQLKRIYKCEQEIAKSLKDISMNENKIKFKKENLDTYLNKQSNSSEEQKQAIVNAVTNKISILTGGPGTGKTYTINGIVQFLRLEYPDINIRCLAPTGRAASKMFETTKVVSTTIHSALNSVIYVDEDSGKCYKKKIIEDGEKQNKKIDGEFFIIDEMSMVDVEILSSFLSNCNPNAQLLFVGDEDQLPSVQVGCVLREVLNSACFPTVRLSKIFRQKETSMIAINAHRYKSRNPEEVNQIEFKKNSDMMFMKSSDANIQQNLLKLINALVNKQNIQLKDILILSPMKVGPNGTIALNSFLQKSLNTDKELKEGVYKGKKTYRVGDPVIQLKNDKERGENGVYNGLIGHVKDIVTNEINNEIICMSVDFGDITGVINYTDAQMEDLDLAYAVTVHKSQGSESKVVILLVTESQQRMLTMNLVYTGITRAEDTLICLGEPTSFYESAYNLKGMDRLSDLGNTIQQSFK